MCASTLGGVAGALIFLIARRGAMPTGFVRDTWFPAEIMPPPAEFILVLTLVPLFALAVAPIGARRLIVTPLGIVRPTRRRRRGALWALTGSC
jgi:hypothetical protein